MRLFQLLAWRPLRQRPLRALLAIGAVAAGTAMAVSIMVVQTSVSTSVREFAAELAGPTELRVVGAIRRGGLDPEVVDRVAGTEGVAAAVPVVQAVATLEDVTGTSYRQHDVLVLGVDCRAEALAGSFGCDDELVADHGDVPLAVGPGVAPGSRLQTNTGPVRIGDPPVFAGFGDLRAGRFLVYGLPAAQRIFERDGRIDAIYVQPEAGVDVGRLAERLDEVVGEHNAVLTAGDGPPEVELLLASVLPLFTMLGVFGLAIGALLVYNTVTLSLEERRRELAVVGALGGTRRVVAWNALGEAAALGAVGGVLGAIGGRLVAAPIVGAFSGVTEATAAIPLGVHVGWPSLLIGGVLGTVVATAAAAVPTRRALRAAVSEELSGRGAPREGSTANFLARTGVCTVCTLVGVALVLVGRRNGGLSPWQVPVGGLGFAIVTVSLLVAGANLAPLLIRPLARLVAGSPAGRLAVANLLRAPGRTGVMVVAMAGATATAFVTAGYTTGARTAIAEEVRANMDGVGVEATDSTTGANLDVALPDTILDQLADVPGVAEVRHGSVVLAGGGRGDLVAVGAWEDSWILDDGQSVVQGRIDPAAFARGEAVVNTLLARSEGVGAGGTVALPTVDGMVDVKVQAVIHGGGLGGRQVILPWDLHRQLYGELPVRSVNLRPEAGVSFEQLAANIFDTLYAGDRQPDMDIYVSTPDQVIRDAEASVRFTMLPFWTLQQGLLAVSFVAVLSTLLLIGVQRRREMGMLAAAGMTPKRLAQMVLAEAAVAGVVAVALGVLGGVITLWALLQAAPLVIGFNTPFHPDWTSIASSGSVVVVVALVAAAWPALRAARTEVIPALRYE